MKGPGYVGGKLMVVFVQKQVGGSEASTTKTIKNRAYWELGVPFIGVWIWYLEVEAFLEGDGSQDLGGDGAGQHVDLFHSSSVGVLLFPAVKHPPAQ